MKSKKFGMAIGRLAAQVQAYDKGILFSPLIVMILMEDGGFVENLENIILDRFLLDDWGPWVGEQDSGEETGLYQTDHGDIMITRVEGVLLVCHSEEY